MKRVLLTLIICALSLTSALSNNLIWQGTWAATAKECESDSGLKIILDAKTFDLSAFEAFCSVQRATESTNSFNFSLICDTEDGQKPVELSMLVRGEQLYFSQQKGIVFKPTNFFRCEAPTKVQMTDAPIPKRDIRGFKLGMSPQQVDAVAQSQQLICESWLQYSKITKTNELIQVHSCKTKTNQLGLFSFSWTSDNAQLTALIFKFRYEGNVENLVNETARQFGVSKIDKERTRNGEIMYIFDLSGGNILKLFHIGWFDNDGIFALRLENSSMSQQYEDNLKAARERKALPPKF